MTAAATPRIMIAVVIRSDFARARSAISRRAINQASGHQSLIRDLGGRPADRVAKDLGEPAVGEAEVLEPSGRPGGVEDRLGVGGPGERQGHAAALPSRVDPLDAGDRADRPLERPRPTGDPDLESGRTRPGELVDPAFDDEPPVVDDRNALAEPLDEVQLVAGEDHRHALGGLLAQHLGERVDAYRVQPGERLVEDQQRRARAPAPRPAAPAAGCRATAPRPCPPARSARPQPLESRAGGLRGGGRRHAVQLGRGRQLVADAHPRVQAALLGHVAERPPLGRADRPTVPGD